jgi:hypothetical protein
VLALLLCACGSSKPPLPSVVSVTPERVSTSECIQLTVELDEALPIKLDYGRDSVELASLAQVQIAGQDYSVSQLENQGRRFSADVPAGLPVGKQAVRVVLQDGRQLLIEDALEVTPALTIETFRIDPVPNQVRQEPFTVTIRATGLDAHLFQGRVRLRSNRGTLEPAWSAPFQQGVLVQEVTIDDTGGNNVLIEMTDCAGRTVNSNEFRLESKP